MSAPIAESPAILACTLDVPPSVNSMYIHTRFGTRLHPKAEAFRDMAVLRIREALAGEYWPQEAQYRLTLHVWFPNEKQPRDLDNAVKLLQDALAAALGFNDRQVVELHAYHMGYDRARARCELTIEALA